MWPKIGRKIGKNCKDLGQPTDYPLNRRKIPIIPTFQKWPILVDIQLKGKYLMTKNCKNEEKSGGKSEKYEKYKGKRKKKLYLKNLKKKEKLDKNSRNI